MTANGAAHPRTGEEAVAAHRAGGSFVTADGVTTFVRTEGEGDPVVLLHGLPASSYLYRKVLPELASRGFRAIAPDLPGMGLADRPRGFDYTRRGLGAYVGAVLDGLGVDRFHLVVHDAGGPVGFELALARPDALVSLTVFNTVIDLGSTPFPGELLARVSRSAGGFASSPALWRQMMRRVGVWDQRTVSDAEIDAYRLLALGDDGGSGYLAIMRALRTGPGGAHYAAAIDTRRVPYPVRIAWGGHDPILRLRRFAWPLLAASHLPSLTVLPGRHFLQEDLPASVAAIVAENAGAA